MAVEIKAAAIIGDEQNETVGQQFEQDANFGRAGMLDHIVQSFLEGEEEIVPDFSRQRPGRQVERDIKAAANFRGAEEVLSESAEIRRCEKRILSINLRRAIIATNVASDARTGSNRAAFFQTSMKIS